MLHQRIRRPVFLLPHMWSWRRLRIFKFVKNYLIWRGMFSSFEWDRLQQYWSTGSKYIYFWPLLFQIGTLCTDVLYAENERAMPIRLHCNELRALCLTTNALCRRGRCLISDPLSLKRHSSESNRPTSFLVDFYERSNIFLRKSSSAPCKSPLIWL